MSFTKSKTVTVRKNHRCLYCSKEIPIGTQCTYGVTTDPEHVGYQGSGIYYGHICQDCFDINNNPKSLKEDGRSYERDCERTGY